LPGLVGALTGFRLFRTVCNESGAAIFESRDVSGRAIDGVDIRRARHADFC
jgi:hypothetical protein